MRIETLPIPLAPPSTSDAAQIDRVARDMEGLFAKMMIQQMRQTTLGDSMFPGAAGQFRDLHDQQIAKTLTQGPGLGLADMIVRQLQQQSGVHPAAGAGVEALPLSLAKQGSTPMLPLDAYVRPLPAKPLTLVAASAPAKANWIAAADVPRNLPVADVPRSPSAVAGQTSVVPIDDAPVQAQVEAFVARVWSHAQQVGRKLGVDPRAIVAQSALETGWGRSTISAQGQSANNYFGIKATGAWRGEQVTTTTKEFVDGAFRLERAAFRAYEGVAQSFADYAALLKRSPRYAQALGAGGNIREFAQALQRGGYATDPDYARKIEAIATGPTLGRALARLGIEPATEPAAAPAARHALFAGSVGAMGGL